MHLCIQLASPCNFNEASCTRYMQLAHRQTDMHMPSRVRFILKRSSHLRGYSLQFICSCNHGHGTHKKNYLKDNWSLRQHAFKDALDERCAAAVPEGFGRKLLSSVPFNEQTYKNRYTEYTSIDVEFIFSGNASSSILQLSRPGQWNGYLAVQLGQQGITVSHQSVQCHSIPDLTFASSLVPFSFRKGPTSADLQGASQALELLTSSALMPQSGHTCAAHQWVNDIWVQPQFERLIILLHPER